MRELSRSLRSGIIHEMGIAITHLLGDVEMRVAQPPRFGASPRLFV